MNIHCCDFGGSSVPSSSGYNHTDCEGQEPTEKSLASLHSQHHGNAWPVTAPCEEAAKPRKQLLSFLPRTKRNCLVWTFPVRCCGHWAPHSPTHQPCGTEPTAHICSTQCPLLPGGDVLGHLCTQRITGQMRECQRWPERPSWLSLALSTYQAGVRFPKCSPQIYSLMEMGFGSSLQVMMPTVPAAQHRDPSLRDDREHPHDGYTQVAPCYGALTLSQYNCIQGLENTLEMH